MGWNTNFVINIWNWVRGNWWLDTNVILIWLKWHIWMTDTQTRSHESDNNRQPIWRKHENFAVSLTFLKSKNENLHVRSRNHHIATFCQALVVVVPPALLLLSVFPVSNLMKIFEYSTRIKSVSSITSNIFCIFQYFSLSPSQFFFTHFPTIVAQNKKNNNH